MEIDLFCASVSIVFVCVEIERCWIWYRRMDFLMKSILDFDLLGCSYETGEKQFGF